MCTTCNTERPTLVGAARNLRGLRNVPVVKLRRPCVPRHRVKWPQENSDLVPPKPEPALCSNLDGDLATSQSCILIQPSHLFFPLPKPCLLCSFAVHAAERARSIIGNAFRPLFIRHGGAHWAAKHEHGHSDPTPTNIRPPQRNTTPPLLSRQSIGSSGCWSLLLPHTPLRPTQPMMLNLPALPSFDVCESEQRARMQLSGSTLPLIRADAFSFTLPVSSRGGCRSLHPSR